NNTLMLRGGWRLGASLILENFPYPQALYRDYAIDTGTDTVRFGGRPSITNYDVVLSFGTPQFPLLSPSGSVVPGLDVNLAGWAPGYILWASVTGAYRPTERVRLEAIYNETRVVRPDDRSTVTLTQIPRLKLEYQVSRPVFL